MSTWDIFIFYIYLIVFGIIVQFRRKINFVFQNFRDMVKIKLSVQVKPSYIRTIRQ